MKKIKDPDHTPNCPAWDEMMNRKPQHTPTPWAVDGNSIRTDNEAMDCIALVEKECGHMKLPMGANAAFIVKAVNCHEELLFALNQVLELIEDSSPTNRAIMRPQDEPRIQLAKKVIAKAEGK